METGLNTVQGALNGGRKDPIWEERQRRDNNETKLLIVSSKIKETRMSWGLGYDRTLCHDMMIVT